MVKLDLPEDVRRRFQLLGLLGQGGMGVVVRARDTALDRDVVIKTLRSRLARNEHLVERFRREARTLAQLNHPRVLGLLDFGAEGETLYTVHPYLEGTDLRRRVAREPPGVDQVATWFDQALDGLAHAHEAGILHRDIKPENLFVGVDDQLVLIDFGLAKAEDAATLTATDSLLGTPAYLDPAVIRGELWGPTTDLYALGVTIYEVLVGKNPFLGADVGEVLANHTALIPPAPRELRPEIPAGLSSLVMNLLDKAPGNRPPSAALTRRRLAAASAGRATQGLASAGPGAVTAPLPRPAVTDVVAPLHGGAVRPASPPAPSRWRLGLLGISTALVGVGAFALAMSGGDTAPRLRLVPVDPVALEQVTAVPRDLQGLVKATRGELDHRFDTRAPGEPWGDPATWRAREGAFEGARRLLAWVARGGDPASLPDGFRQGLQELDADSRGLGGQPVFGAVARVSPAPLAIRCEELPFRNVPPQGLCAGLGTSWMATALNAADRAATRLRAYRAVRGRPPRLRAFMADTNAQPLVARSPDFRYEEAYVHSLEGRSALASWMSEGVDACEDFLFALGQALRREPVSPGLVVHAAHFIHELRWLLFSHLGQVPAARLLGGSPRNPLGHMVATALRVRQDRAQRPVGEIDPELPGRYQEGLLEALALVEVSANSPEVAPAMHYAVQRLARAPDSLQDAAAWGEAFDELARLTSELPPEAQRSVWTVFLAHHEPRVDLPGARARVEALREAVPRG